jgi:hypothetical protein
MAKTFNAFMSTLAHEGRNRQQYKKGLWKILLNGRSA